MIRFLPQLLLRKITKNVEHSDKYVDFQSGHTCPTETETILKYFPTFGNYLTSFHHFCFRE